MSGKRAKLIRRIAKDLATENVIQSETQYNANRNIHSLRTRTIVVSHCERAVINQVKQVAQSAKNLPAVLFEHLAYRAIS